MTLDQHGLQLRPRFRPGRITTIVTAALVLGVLGVPASMAYWAASDTIAGVALQTGSAGLELTHPLDDVAARVTPAQPALLDADGSLAARNTGSVPLAISFDVRLADPVDDQNLALSNELVITMWFGDGSCSPTPPDGVTSWQDSAAADTTHGDSIGVVDAGSSQPLCVTASLPGDASAESQTAERAQILITMTGTQAPA